MYKQISFFSPTPPPSKHTHSYSFTLDIFKGNHTKPKQNNHHIGICTFITYSKSLYKQCKFNRAKKEIKAHTKLQDPPSALQQMSAIPLHSQAHSRP